MVERAQGGGGRTVIQVDYVVSVCLFVLKAVVCVCIRCVGMCLLWVNMKCSPQVSGRCPVARSEFVCVSSCRVLCGVVLGLTL